VSDFFISRPIFAAVVALVFVLAGGICMTQLPIALYPEIAPPQVQVTSQYVGASAQVVADSVTTPIEEQINGVEGMIYLSSVSDNNGNSTITVTFEIGYDLSIAAVDVMNMTEIAKPEVPMSVQRTGISVLKQSPDMTLVVNLVSPDGSRDSAYLSNYADINICDVLRRVPGVGFVNVFGERKYSIRVWLDPAKLSSLGITGGDVSEAIRGQNLQVAAGKIGGPPTRKGQIFQFQINTLGRLSQVEQFADIILRTRPDGSVVRIKDVGYVELGAENYDTTVGLNNKTSIGIAIYQLPGSNALQVSEGIQEKMEKLSERFPEGVEFKIVYDTTTFVKASIDEVIETLFIAILLVFLVVFVFLQTWRATLIAAITIPVSLIGTFALMTVLGFSINTLSMLGLVLAIGLVVDDAIVVVENVQRQFEKGITDPREAARIAMGEVTSPIIATTLVLMAVFVPVAFIPGIVGQLYNQFALTIACSVGISSINSLSLSPALCGVLLKPDTGQKSGWIKRLAQYKWLGWLQWAEWFNKGFSRLTEHYEQAVKKFIRWWPAVFVAFAVLVAGTLWLFRLVPTGFLPEEDQGYVIALIQMPTGTAIGQTEQAAAKMSDIAKTIPGIVDSLAIVGLNIVDNAKQSSAATVYFILKPWSERHSTSLHADAIMETLHEKGKTIRNAEVVVFNAPPIPGLATTGGFQFELQDIENAGPKTLDAVAQRLIKTGNDRKELAGLSTTFSTDVPQLYLDIDRTKTKSLNVPMNEVFKTLEICLGSYYVNQFNKYGRVYRVYLQAESNARDTIDDISELYVRNRNGEMIPISALAKVEHITGPETIQHYNIYPAALINGNPAPGHSTGEAIEALEEVADEVLPKGMSYEWTGIMYQQLEAGNLAPVIFALALVFVFLFLSAQYESWTAPFMVMLAVPLALFGGLAAQWFRGNANDIYCQIGMVMLIGLASKNAILIVEFARRRREEGLSIVDAAAEAARIRLRPILMTAFAFIFGVVPLVIASGAGAATRQSLGTTVFGGMLSSTLLSLIVVPVLFVCIQKTREWALASNKDCRTGGLNAK